jgi:hypothetical protein
MSALLRAQFLALLVLVAEVFATAATYLSAAIAPADIARLSAIILQVFVICFELGGPHV